MTVVVLSPIAFSNWPCLYRRPKSLWLYLLYIVGTISLCILDILWPTSYPKYINLLGFVGCHIQIEQGNGIYWSHLATNLTTWLYLTTVFTSSSIALPYISLTIYSLLYNTYLATYTYVCVARVCVSGCFVCACVRLLLWTCMCAQALQVIVKSSLFTYFINERRIQKYLITQELIFWWHRFICKRC